MSSLGKWFSHRLLVLICGTLLAFSSSSYAQENSTNPSAIPATSEQAELLASDIRPWLEVLQGVTKSFSVKVAGELWIDNMPQSIGARLTRFDDNAFDLEVTHADYEVVIRRRGGSTALALPKHKLVYLGIGTFDTNDHVAPQGAVDRLISSGSVVSVYSNLLSNSELKDLVGLILNVADIHRSGSQWLLDETTKISFEHLDSGARVSVVGEKIKLSLELSKPDEPAECSDWPGLEIKEIERADLERHLSRGCRRALEVFAPAPQLVNPPQIAKRVEHGYLSYVDGQRLAVISGTPEQIGVAHGQLLRNEAIRCIDSVLYAFGTVQTVVTGKWFPDELAAAYERLRPHIPAEHIAETRALAVTIGQDPEVLEVLNVFPEMFHCSGFAVFGSATEDGTLYHGRVLDYMTTIGLQDCATTFIVKPEGKSGFANIGYAGFTGSVSGMNEHGISLGEMGGRGEGDWDGVPMATLMRRALEECQSLDDVMKLWAGNPRTCEYYYVFADGKSNQAVGVAATPQSIQFVRPGEGHELLGDGIADAVVLSAGSRLETLRNRVIEHHGKIDSERAKWLMSRPVAMQSNLHNVLFVPAKGEFYVANASHSQPAAERPYVMYKLDQLLPKTIETAKGQ